MEDAREKTNYEYIEQVYRELLSERDILEKEKAEHLDVIKEIELYIQSLFEKEDVDYGMFSPRNVQSIYKDKIDLQNQQKQELLDTNLILDSKIRSITSKMDSLLQVMKSLEHMDESQHITGDMNVSYLILDIQEKERQRIARDLHDNTVQNLTHLIHKIELSSKFIDQDSIRAKMELMDISRNVKSIINDMRDVIFNLRPMEFDDMGLKVTFEKFLTDQQFKSGITIRYEIDDITLNHQLSDISLYHIVKECVNNSIKHSMANIIQVNIAKQEDNIHIIIEDDGIGFDEKKVVDNHHFGLSLLKESVSILGGTIDIQSAINIGTRIDVYIPCTMEKSEGSLND